jgi:hypothetical protein
MAKTPKTFEQLERVVHAVEIPAKRLAVAVGNFHGANDFANEHHEMWCGWVLGELLEELTASIVVRANALFEPPKRANDMTLTGAADILEVAAIRAEAIERAKGWTHPNVEIAKIRAARIGKDLEAFLQIVRHLDVEKLRDYRNWVLAHNTSNPKPPLTYVEVWEIAEATLLAADHLRRVVAGDDDNTVGLAKVRRAQSLTFWQRLNEKENVDDPGGD